jgi:hypothetical protein
MSTLTAACAGIPAKRATHKHSPAVCLPGCGRDCRRCGALLITALTRLRGHGILGHRQLGSPGWADLAHQVVRGRGGKTAAAT